MATVSLVGEFIIIIGLLAETGTPPLHYTQQVQLAQQLDDSLELDKELVEPSASLHSHLVHTPPGSRALVQESKVSALPWPATLQAFLHRRGVTEARALQATMWPAVSKLQSMLVVAPPSTRSPVSSWAEGKTLGWLLPAPSAVARRGVPRRPGGATAGHSSRASLRFHRGGG